MSFRAPKIVMTLLVRDEEDIIESNLRFHYAQGVEFFIVMDHQSRDRTPEIVKEFCHQGIAELIHQPDPGYRQADWVTWMARHAASEHGADWVINNDADEFWWPLDGTLSSSLAGVPARYGAVYVPRFNFHPVRKTKFEILRARAKAIFLRAPRSSKDMDSGSGAQDGSRSGVPFFETMTVCDVNSVNSLGLPLPGKTCHRAHPGVEVAMGNHTVVFPDASEVWEAPLIEILHFPVRSAAQFCNKIAVGGAALQHSPEVPGGETWRALFSGPNEQSAARYFQSTCVNAPDIARMLASGRVRRDTRLRDFMRESQAGVAHAE